MARHLLSFESLTGSKTSHDIFQSYLLMREITQPIRGNACTVAKA
jgi:hypothetical protein